MYKDLFSYEIVRRKRKSLGIAVERDGSLTVIAPLDLPEEEIRDWVYKKRDWIIKHQLNYEHRNNYSYKRQFVNGEGFLYGGRSYKLQVVEEQNIPLRLFQGHFCLRRDELSFAQEHFKNFYRTKLSGKIGARVEHFRLILGVKINDVKVMDLQNRWGSCTKEGTILFHWKLMMAPMDIIDYVVLHELTHIKHMNHSMEFWSVIETIMPDYRQRMKWLEENGVKLSL
ncbi:M48 family metallopeptidase [Bacillus cereus group sp. BfR-BA-01324]|uniref:M48 family metallopeptidase n=1 Tax=Bacillus cereus group sp. BfR-BA-01324 TaxID=2920300 RepID=UPI001F56C865|nr:SprT family zinc-dependent metalloprotease [Bacillus cereus group sp. BfR-BA-01324]